MIKLAIMILSVGSVGLLSYQVFPALADKLLRSQTKKAEVDTDRMKIMFINVRTNKLILIYTLLPIVLGGIGLAMIGNFIGAVVGGIIGLLLPNIIIKQMDSARKHKFTNQLVDALLLLSSSLKGGLSLVQAFEAVATEMPAPINQEFATVLNENKMGISLDESLKKLNERIPSVDLNLIVTAILLARETGGNLPEIFTNLIASMREKRKIAENVMTLTLQGRLQGIIMSLLPIGFALFVFKSNPDFFQIMMDTEIGRILLMVCVGLEVVGIFLIRKISKIDI